MFRKKLTACCLVFLLAGISTGVLSGLTQSKNAQPVPPPDFSSNKRESGVIYTFAVPDSVTVRYRLAESVSQAYAEGECVNGDSIFVLEGIEAVAWSVFPDGSASIPTVLYPKTVSPFASIEEAFISPAPGTWANKQSLVVDVPAQYEVYYSISGTDPLTAGFAYDGPVLLDSVGHLTVSVAIIAPDESVYKKNITYSVTEKAVPMLPVSANEPVIECSTKRPVIIPPSMRYSLGNDEKKQFLDGKTIVPDVQSDILRYIPLVVQDRDNLYRYVLQTGEKTGDFQLIPSVSGIDFIEWNYFSFPGLESVQYSLDRSPWTPYINPVFIDRTEPHTLAWSSPSFKNGEVQAMALPPKPELTGIPASGITNRPVVLRTQNDNYVLRYEKMRSKSDYLPAVIFDVLSGESCRFAAELAVYYNGIRQGTVSAEFTINKKIPTAPRLDTSISGPYSASPVTLSVQADEPVFVRIVSGNTVLALGKDPDFSSLKTPVAAQEFIPLASSSIQLPGNEKSAVLYIVQAYCEDLVGNRSPVVQSSICVDRYTVFVSPSGQKTKQGSGAPFDPYVSLDAAVAEVNKRPYARLAVSGIFSGVGNLEFISQCEITGSGVSRLQFEPRASVSLRQGSSIKMSGLELIQNVQSDGAVNNSLSYVYQPLVIADQARFEMNNCTVTLSGGTSRAFITSASSVIALNNSSIAVTAQTYAVVADVRNSHLSAAKSRMRCVAPTSLVFSVSGGTIRLESTQSTLHAEIGRVAELSKTQYSFMNNEFAFEPQQKKPSGLVQYPVWADASSIETAYSSNKVTGFSSDRVLRN